MRSSILPQDLLKPVRRHLYLHAGALFLQQHRDARVALAPAAFDGLGEFLQREIRQAHRHVQLAPERGGKRDILVREVQAEVRRVERRGQELIREPIEDARGAWTDPELGAGIFVKSAHFQDMRIALQQAYLETQ